MSLCTELFSAAIHLAGQVLDLKVVSVDVPRCRVALSLRQMQKDPLQTTMDSIQWKDTVQAPAEVEQIIQVLELTDGINGVKLGRQAEEPHTVAQVRARYLPASHGFVGNQKWTSIVDV